MKIEKNQKIKKHTAAIIDFIKTVLIFFLTASMLVSAGYYINEKQNAGRAEEISPEKRRIFESGKTFLAEINENQINPVQITVTAGNSSFTAIYNGKAVSDIYEDLKLSVRGLFSVNSICRRLEKSEGEELWRKCLGKENSVYIRYAGDYIYPVIYVFLDKTWDIRNAADGFPGSGELAMVRELFIVDEDPVYGVSRDFDGNIAVFEPGPEEGNIIKRSISAGNLSAYNNNVGVIPCEFLKDKDISEKTGVNKNNIKNLKLPEDFQLFNHYNIYSPVLFFSNPLLDVNGEINADKSFIKELFKILNFNIESAGSHPNEEGGITFVDGKNTVGFYNDGKILYNYKPSKTGAGASVLTEGGIHLSRFLGYGGDYYTAYEKIKAASVFVSSLSGELTGGSECCLYLKNITAESDGNLKVFFSRYYDGIKIKINGSDEAIIITISKDSITEVMIKSFYADPQDLIKAINPMLILGDIDGRISAAISEYESAVYDYADPGNDMDETGEENGELLDLTPKSKEEFAEGTAQKYNLKYDKIQDKFIVNGFELAYNIEYTGGNNIKTQYANFAAEWVIK